MSQTERRTDPAPLVSFIKPARNRGAFVGQSISYFLRTDYSRKELINRVDVEESVARALSLGSKRNRGCDRSSGELSAYRDEHDWIGANGLTVQESARDLDP